MTTMEPPVKRDRAPRPAQAMPTPPEARGAGARYAGTFDDRGHYLPIGYALRLKRIEAGLDQRQLGAATDEVAAEEVKAARREKRTPQWTKGLSPYTINRYENGFHSPVARSAALLAKTLSVVLSRTQGREVVVTPEDLRVRDAPGLAYYLRQVQGDRSDAEFFGALGIPEARARNLMAGTSKWSADELGAVAIAFPPAANAARDVMIDQARKRKGLPAYRAYATRDIGHPDYVPPQEREDRDGAPAREGTDPA